MTGMEWILWSTLVVFYLVCLFTVCTLTFRKGHTALGILGIFLPFLWLIGAILPPKPGSAYEMQEQRTSPGV
jgi:hypothetical protein